MTTDQKGAIAEAAIAFQAMKLGIGVFRPLGDERYDLIFDLRPQLCEFNASGPRIKGKRWLSIAIARVELLRGSGEASIAPTRLMRSLRIAQS
jgi:hypothetical protein